MTLDEPRTSDAPEALQWRTFPAGTAVALLVYGFLFTRLFVGLTAQRPWLGVAGTFCAVLGVCLALVAMPRLAWQSTVGREASALSGAGMMLRALALLPIGLSCAMAMGGDIPHAVQWASLAGLAVIVQAATLRAVWIGLRDKHFLPAVTLALLGLGELVELVGPPARAAAMPGTFWPRVAESLAPVGEGAALFGVPLAFAWSLRSSLRSAGLARVAAFAAMPAAMAVVLATVPLRYPRTTEQVARIAFGARFSLAGGTLAGAPPRPWLVAYSLMFSGLVATAGISLAAQRADRGAAIRRALGWTCVLMAGFGAASPAGAIDPYRTTVLALGVLLLEQAIEREE